MTQEIEIEKLESSSKYELFDLLAQAYIDFPFAESFGLRPELTRKLIETNVGNFLRFRNIWLYGICKNGKLICATLSTSSDISIQSIFACIRFIFSLSLLLRWRILKFVKICLKRPKYKGRNLELISFATLPSYQRQGFGRKMLHFLYESAKRYGYKGINLFTAKGYPAFYFYLREGFKVEKEFILPEGIPQCWMRKTLVDGEN